MSDTATSARTERRVIDFCISHYFIIKGSFHQFPGFGSGERVSSRTLPQVRDQDAISGRQLLKGML